MDNKQYQEIKYIVSILINNLADDVCPCEAGIKCDHFIKSKYLYCKSGNCVEGITQTLIKIMEKDSKRG